MATKKPESVEAFVLCDCQYGKCGEVVTLPAEDAALGKNAGMLDLNQAAIAQAKE